MTTRTVVGLWTLAALIVVATVVVVRKVDAADGAVQRSEFHDTTRALRADLTNAATEAKNAAEGARAVSCYIAKYPAGLCEGVTQAGRQR